MKKLFTTIIITFAFLAATFSTAAAAVQLNPDFHPDYAPAVNLGTKALPSDYGNYFLQLIAGGLLYLAGPVAILIIAIAGLRYVTSHGAEEAITGAKKTLEFAIIGLIVIMLSYAAVRAVISILLQTDIAPPQVVTGTTPAPTTPTSAAAGAAAGAAADAAGAAARAANAGTAPTAPSSGSTNNGYDPNQPSI